MSAPSALEKARQRFADIVAARQQWDVSVSVTAHALTPAEAIGKPDRDDFPLQTDHEKMIEAEVLGAKGQAFTDRPGNFQGTLRDVLDLSLDTNRNRAFFIATLNAAAHHAGITARTVHCKDDEPTRCARRLAVSLKLQRPDAKIGIIGLQPALAEAIISKYSSEQVILSDLQVEKIGTAINGVKIRDGSVDNFSVVDDADIILITGTTLVNGSFDALFNYLTNQKKDYFIFGVTCAAVSSLLDYNRYCPFGRNR
ncbi:hypothetical protein KKA00_05275 [bacterium]|nr:hypothetical protein [bacterium]